MTQNPDFFLTAAGEYTPLAEPRACWVKERLRDAQDKDYLVVEIRPPFYATDAPLAAVSSVVLSARHRGESVAHITSWPIYVYVSRVLNGGSLEIERIDKSQFQVVAWARLYPSVEGAAHDAERHAAALRSARSPEAIHAAQIRFVGEQDGIPERALKERLVRLFAPDERVWKAYLARTDFGPGTAIGATLCLRTVMGPDSALVARVGEVFAPLFRTRESLDILFIDDEQEHEVARVCKPFYIRRISRRV